MLDTTWGRVLVAAVVGAAIVALLAWARNDPGVGERETESSSEYTLSSDGYSVALGGTHRVD